MGQQKTGVAASPGIAVGKAKVYSSHTVHTPQYQVDDTAAEIERFTRAVSASADDLLSLEAKVSAELGPDEAKLMEAHRLILQDPEFTGSVTSHIETDAINAEAALRVVSDSLIALFESMDNEYMRGRAADIADITSRVMAQLLGLDYGFNAGNDTDMILVAKDLHPSDTVQLDLSRVKGFVTDVGGRTSHTAIMARTRGIPAIVGLGDVSETVSDGTPLIVDGSNGLLIVNPSNEEVARYLEQAQIDAARAEQLHALIHESSVTLDGHQVELAANIGVPGDAVIGVAHGAEGVGLFRSEFLFMNRDSLPSEEEQFQAYQEAVQTLDGKPVIIRTMDIGGDKSLDYLQLPAELNPFLGYRAIRISLDREDMFKTQLRAILRASHYGRVKVMYPMIATRDEVVAANEVLEAAKQELRSEGIPFDEDMEVGIMVEIPAAAIAADQLAEVVDFFSIGTNDLIQYTMACDRMNEKVSYLYQPYHPSILRLVKMVIDAAHQHGKWAGMCGEMAGDLNIVPVLVGLGIDELSMSPPSILPVREQIRQSRFEDLQELAAEALRQSTSDAVKNLVVQATD
ncbi:phosphoenolpyruvate--protein phosphotransferase [Alicyclobacillus ferrooxydans]|uniref:Phosphoenolpyruvate-protein phosphotransferase n=1 Tax=Alicyclobacillus ferrooxydans TaxID=471514 RepID=A0A0P9EKQ7_9BACL|nr:phosphoenolpyruvate--protein phosphotransferase [Alicyclobacillus ferrooxydans]KPV43744.1 phosphoenolpyruvate-protein phosphotransferase [Alicyclobacillus ferrooxydans]